MTSKSNFFIMYSKMLAHSVMALVLLAVVSVQLISPSAAVSVTNPHPFLGDYQTNLTKLLRTTRASILRDAVDQVLRSTVDENIIDHSREQQGADSDLSCLPSTKIESCKICAIPGQWSNITTYLERSEQEQDAYANYTAIYDAYFSEDNYGDLTLDVKVVLNRYFKDMLDDYIKMECPDQPPMPSTVIHYVIFMRFPYASPKPCLLNYGSNCEEECRVDIEKYISDPCNQTAESDAGTICAEEEGDTLEQGDALIDMQDNCNSLIFKGENPMEEDFILKRVVFPSPSPSPSPFPSAPPAPSPSPSASEEEPDSLPEDFLLIALAIVVIAGIVAVAFFIWKRRSNHHLQQVETFGNDDSMYDDFRD